MANIQKIAEALALLAFRDAQDVAKVLEEEYGITPQTSEKNEKTFTLNVENLKEQQQQIVFLQKEMQEEQKRKQKPYAPRKIGKPRGFPDNMRRRK